MASAEFIEAALNTNVNESDVSAIVGSLETLASSAADSLSGNNQSNGNFVNIQNQGDGTMNSDANKMVPSSSFQSQANQMQGRTFVNQMQAAAPGNLTLVQKNQESVKLIYPQTSQSLVNQANVLQTASPGNIVTQAVGKPVQIQTPLIIKQGTNVNQVGIRPNIVTVPGTNATIGSTIHGDMSSKSLNQNIVTSQAALIGVSPHANLSTNVQIVNMRPGTPVGGQKNIATVSPRVVIGSQQIATRPTGPGITLQTLQGFQPGQQGHLLLKTENGQFQLLRVGPPTTPAAGNVHPGQSIRLTTVAAPGVAVASSSGMTMVGNIPSSPSPLQPTQVAVVQSPLPQTIQTTMANAQNNQQLRPGLAQVTTTTPANQKASIDNLKEKCRKFLSNLLDLSSKEPKSVERNVRILIQELIDMRVEPEAFCARLERLLNASPQPCLIGFLKKTLPILRQSLLNKELVIDGIHPPPANIVYSNASTPPSPTILNQTLPMQQTSGIVLPPLQSTIRPTVLPHTQSVISPTTSSAKTTNALRNVTKPNFQNSSKTFIKVTTSLPSAGQSGTSKQIVKEKDRKSFSTFSQGSFMDIDKMAGDDDINDVAAMGGVNLAEETQRILGSTELIGTQIRSCKDEYLAAMGPLQARLKQIAMKHGLEEPGFDVAALISHAVQERMKNFVEKLSCIAEHRMDVIKLNPNYEVTRDIKGQLKFLEELDRFDRKKREDYEREVLLRVAKSRSKSEDPEQVKLKEKAKEMQRAEMEEMRQREANLTALQAIGPRKKPRLGPNVGDSSTVESNTAEIMLGAKNGVNRSTAPIRARMKRVNFRDLLFLLEQEKETARSTFLYKCYLK
ncbi:transcription initiation factor TFIID subunit 4-like isoform X2 [Arctopsyche grandis]|uniref:transcription initiation factor TFIID subunit 4-like isoform X2 n=1 Tax=Arctopsyche grandis TaxID=121162 RepID=UPI00406D6D3E